MSQVVIRPATGEDLQSVIGIGHRTWPVTYGPIAGDDYVEMGLAKWWTAEATIPAIRAGRVTVAQVDDAVVGVATVGPLKDRQYLALWKLYVLPEYQSHGLGRMLMDDVLATAREDGYDEIRLSYLDGNDHAGRFYARNGFVEYDREAGGTGIPDSIWVRRPLRDATSDHPKDDPTDPPNGEQHR